MALFSRPGLECCDENQHISPGKTCAKGTFGKAETPGGRSSLTDTPSATLLPDIRPVTDGYCRKILIQFCLWMFSNIHIYNLVGLCILSHISDLPRGMEMGNQKWHQLSIAPEEHRHGPYLHFLPVLFIKATIHTRKDNSCSRSAYTCV